ncbi:MAG: pilus assembly protein PilM, partial [Nitrospirota bacterium]
MTRRWRSWWEAAPEAGIYIGAGCVATAAVEPDRARRLKFSRVDPLPPGAVVPSPVESNIRDSGLVVDRLKEATAPSRWTEVAISLPDPTVRVAILELARVPARRADRNALFQHHLERLFLNALGRCRFAYQRLPSPESDGRQRVLVSAIREEILEEYEAVARAAGLLPAVVDIAAFHLYNLYEGQIVSSLQPSQWALFLNLFDQNFTIILLDHEGPRFIRIKALPSDSGGGLAGADLAARVTAEIDASVRAAQTAADVEEPPLINRLFFFSDQPLAGLDEEMRSAY